LTVEEKVFATGVRFDSDHLYVVLANGAEVGSPLAAFPRLRDATPEQRLEYVMEDRGTAIHWAGVDEDIGVAHLLGVPERILDDIVGL
jgi:hypothetical protein